jgi:hypothetical protein
MNEIALRLGLESVAPLWVVYGRMCTHAPVDLNPSINPHALYRQQVRAGQQWTPPV